MAVDAWEMAADCARAIEASKDPTRRALVGTLQKLWIELGNKERLLNEQHVLKEMEDLYALHEVFLGTQYPTSHRDARLKRSRKSLRGVSDVRDDALSIVLSRVGSRSPQ
jgi:hypothetical protein